MNQCVADDRGPCQTEVEPDSPLGLALRHLRRKVGDIPDQDASALRVNVVYYIRFRGRIKIGTSGHPRGRLASLPHKEIMASERGERLLEQRRHAQFASYRIPRTGWFEQHEALMRHTGELRAGVDDPWAHYARWVMQRVALL